MAEAISPGVFVHECAGARAVARRTRLRRRARFHCQESCCAIRIRSEPSDRAVRSIVLRRCATRRMFRPSCERQAVNGASRASDVAGLRTTCDARTARSRRETGALRDAARGPPHTYPVSYAVFARLAVVGGVRRTCCGLSGLGLVAWRRGRRILRCPRA